MKCINCGNKIKDINEKCPKCGAYQFDPEKELEKEAKKDDEVPVSTAIASVLVIIFVTCAVIGFYFAFGRDKLNENNIKRQLNNISGESIIEMYYDDFNGDGSKETFAVTGSGSTNKIINGTLWYIKDTTGINIRSGFSGGINGLIDEKNQKYLSIEINGENGESTSFICGVNKFSNFYEPEASGKFSGVHQIDGRILTAKGKEIDIENPEV